MVKEIIATLHFNGGTYGKLNFTMVLNHLSVGSFFKRVSSYKISWLEKMGVRTFGFERVIA